jgi:hypothetical protein
VADYFASVVILFGSASLKREREEEERARAGRRDFYLQYYFYFSKERRVGRCTATRWQVHALLLALKAQVYYLDTSHFFLYSGLYVALSIGWHSWSN